MGTPPKRATASATPAAESGEPNRKPQRTANQVALPAGDSPATPEEIEVVRNQLLAALNCADDARLMFHLLPAPGQVVFESDDESEPPLSVSATLLDFVRHARETGDDDCSGDALPPEFFGKFAEWCGNARRVASELWAVLRPQVRTAFLAANTGDLPPVTVEGKGYRVAREAVVDILGRLVVISKVAELSPPKTVRDVLEIATDYGITPTAEERAALDRRIDIECSEAVRFLRAESFRPQSAGGDLAIAEQPSGRGLSVDEYNALAIKTAQEDRGFVHLSQRGWAEKLGCSAGMVAKLPLWKATMEQSGRGKGQQARREAVPLTDAVLANAGQEDPALRRLIDEQEADFEPSPLEKIEKKPRVRKRL